MSQSQPKNGQDGSGKAMATFGGGCFWCTEAVFDELKGVESVESGYAGGSVPNPSYRAVCSGTTGHAEAVQITYDPQVVSYRELLEAFFATHDPTTLNRQGADVGTQYRSVIFYHDEQQKQAAQQIIKELDAAKIWKNAIVTQLEPYSAFYQAEDYHQEYYRQNEQQPYCQYVISPKMKKFREQYRDRLKQAQPS